MGDASLREMLGASLVTYDRHLEPPDGAWDYPLQPKLVYVQYQAVDPVTQMSALVVVPAQMSLDVFADPNYDWAPAEEEEEEPEEEVVPVDEDEEERRKKLKSSINGDPILSRAKPAPVPDAYFAPLRHEHVVSSSSSSKRRPQHASVENAGTMSSFLRAGGKDKYASSRLGEIDHILHRAALPRQQTSGGQARQGGFPSLGGMLGEAVQDRRGTSVDKRGLAAHLAKHIIQVPCLHTRRRLASHRSLTGEEDGAPQAEHALARPASDDELPRVSSKEAVALGADSGTVIGSDGGVAHKSWALGGLVAGSARPDARREVKRVKDQRILLLKREPKLRDLDPHVSIGGHAPTQRLHDNWPDNLKRQLARHFYGMSPGEIFEEEEQERLRELGSLARSKDIGGGFAPDADEGDHVMSGPHSRRMVLEPLSKGSPRRLAHEQRISRSVAGTGQVAYGLEIRVKNSGRPNRVVVSRDVERAKGREEAATRPTLLLDVLSANPKRMGRKY